MKTIELTGALPPLMEILDLADQENVILRTPDGREFVVAEIDDFDREIVLTHQNQELSEFLAQRSREQQTFSLDEVKASLGLD